MKKLIGTVKTSPVVKAARDEIQAMIDSGDIRNEGKAQAYWDRLADSLEAADLVPKDFRPNREDNTQCLGWHGKDHSELYFLDVEEESRIEFQEILGATGL